MPDFRLRVFEAVARHLSFTKAAQKLFITQPAVTKHIHELEKHYEPRLPERRGNHRVPGASACRCTSIYLVVRME